MIEFILNNYDLIILGIIVIAALAVIIHKLQGTTREQILAWLLQAVILAEKEFGGGTGKLKLSSVYDKFIVRFPVVAKLISYDKFDCYVNIVLKEMEKLLGSNSNIANIVGRST